MQMAKLRVNQTSLLETDKMFVHQRLRRLNLPIIDLKLLVGLMIIKIILQIYILPHYLTIRNFLHEILRINFYEIRVLLGLIIRIIYILARNINRASLLNILLILKLL